METATFAAGCFWCTEAVFSRLKGIVSVTSGYTGGDVENPSYEAFSTGQTGHAEAINIEFNPAEISYDTLLDVYWHTHNPTTINQQGSDVGPQYRSAIFYHSPEQKSSAEKIKALLEASGEVGKPIVTEIVPFTHFYSAEEYHQKFYDANPTHPYCQIVIDPKIDKLLAKYKSLLKDPRSA